MVAAAEEEERRGMGRRDEHKKGRVNDGGDWNRQTARQTDRQTKRDVRHSFSSQGPHANGLQKKGYSIDLAYFSSREKSKVNGNGLHMCKVK